MAEGGPARSTGSAGVAPALSALGRDPSRPPPRPVLHGRAGTLISIGAFTASRSVVYSGAFLRPEGVEFLGPPAPASGLGETLPDPEGPGRRMVDLLVEAARQYLERIEEIDTRLATTEERGRSVPLPEVWSLHRDAAAVGAQVGRGLVALAELAGPLGRAFPGIERALPSLLSEFERTADLCTQARQSLSDLILLRNAEESNRIAEAANELSRTSNRIAALANISNIRMLGLTYVALLLGLVSAVVLIPNTAATILGMPSAGWVPGLWVDVSLLVLAIIPIAIVFTRPWVLGMLRGFSTYEHRVREGLSDLPELSPEAAERTDLGRGAPRSPQR